MGYDSPYGTGNRTAVITITQDAGIFASDSPATFLIDGSYSWATEWKGGYPSLSGKAIKFQFPIAIVVDHVKYIQDLNVTNNHGTWKVQGSNDDAIWDDLCVCQTLGGAAETVFDLSSNVTAYIYYRLLGCGDAVANSQTFPVEVEFSFTAVSVLGAIGGISYANVASVNSVAVANVKSINGVA